MGSSRVARQGGHVAHQAALEIFLPERRAPIDTQAVERKSVEPQPGRDVEGGAHVFHGLIGVTDDKEPVHDLEAGGLGVGHRGLDLRQRLLLLQPVKHLLAAAFDAEHQRAAVGLGHGGEEMLGARVDTPLASPLHGDAGGIDTVADCVDPFGLQQEMVVDEVGRPPTRGSDLCNSL